MSFCLDQLKTGKPNDKVELLMRLVKACSEKTDIDAVFGKV